MASIDCHVTPGRTPCTVVTCCETTRGFAIMTVSAQLLSKLYAHVCFVSCQDVDVIKTSTTRLDLSCKVSPVWVKNIVYSVSKCP